ncbi:MAG: HEAT repeat domain-containing protein [Promethearchaeota archaeon]
MNLDKSNYEIIEVSKVDDKIIKKLIDNLKLDLSDNFFISFESLIKLGKKAESALEAVIHEIDDHHQFKKEIFNLLLNLIKNNEIENPLLLNLYHPDFIVRANALMQIEKNNALKNLNFILPLISDPDDSVRWAVMRLIDSFDQSENQNPIIFKKLKKQAEIEQNPVIQKKIKKILKNIMF